MSHRALKKRYGRSHGGRVWGRELYGAGAVPFSDLAVGDTFKMPDDPDDALLEKISAGRYKVIRSADRFAVSLKFSTGKGTAVIPTRSST